MKILVVGDMIVDLYEFYRATGLCPEAPAPKLQLISEKMSEGGASLVAQNLRSLAGKESIISSYGSLGRKRRIFAGHTLICRMDYDRDQVVDAEVYAKALGEIIPSVDAIVVSDYNKGAMSDQVATVLRDSGKLLFVDAKHDAGLYDGAFCMFPNEHEYLKSEPKHVIRKLGAFGCAVDGVPVPTTQQPVYDVTGAGDVFMAAFVDTFMGLRIGAPADEDIEFLMHCAHIANLAAGISVRHLGTHVVTEQELLDAAGFNLVPQEKK